MSYYMNFEIFPHPWEVLCNYLLVAMASWKRGKLCVQTLKELLLQSCWSMNWYFWNFSHCYRHPTSPPMFQFSSVAQSCPTLCNPINHSTPGLPVHHQLSEFTQTHVHRVSDAIQPFHPLSSPSPPAPNPSQHQSLFQWVNSPHQVAKVLEFQL